MRVFFGLLFVTTATAAPIRLGQSGRVLDAAGESVNGTHSVTVSLRDAADSVAYSETFEPLTLDNGYYGVILGVGDTLQDTILDEPDLYVAIEVDGVLLPGRQLLVHTPRAARAEHATTASSAEQATLADRAILADRIAISGAAAPGGCANAGEIVFDTSWSGLRICVGGEWTAIGVRTIVSTGGVRRYSDGTVANSCLDYLNPTGGYIYAGEIGDGPYAIDVDGEGPLPEADVTCDMTNGGWTEFHHDREVEFQSPSGETPLSILLPVTYETTVAVLQAAEASATLVEQFISKRCRDSLIDNGTQYTGWRYPANSLAPSSAWPNRAECDRNDATLRTSAGMVTGGTYLPIIRIDNGDSTGPGELSYFTVGPFRVK